MEQSELVGQAYDDPASTDGIASVHVTEGTSSGDVETRKRKWFGNVTSNDSLSKTTLQNILESA